MLFVLFPDYWRLQTFFDGRPYGETEVGISISIVVAVSYIYFIDLIKQMLFRIFSEYVRHTRFNTGSAYRDFTGSFPFLLLRELVIAQLDVRQLVWLFRMLSSQSHRTVQISDSCFQASVEDRFVHSRIASVHCEVDIVFFYYRFNAFCIHSIDLSRNEFSAAANLIGNFLRSFEIVVSYYNFFCPVAFCTSAFNDLCR